jgi:hypothetical protein
MRPLLLISAIFLTVLLIFAVPRAIEEYNIHKSNNSVVVTVVRLPNCSSGNRNKFIHISYEGSVHILRTKCKYVSNLTEGQRFEMLHKPGTEIFLFKEEDVTFELISVAVLVLATTVCMVINLLPNKHKGRSRTTMQF